MKANQPVTSIEEMCRLLRRSRLLAAEEILALVQRWRSETGERGDAPASLERFSSWLVAGRFLTEYQVTALLNGHADHFFLAGWKLLDRVGKGKQARIYKGIDRVGRLAAIKVLPPSRARLPRERARFEREGRLGEKLDHVNIVRILGAGNENGLNHLVMEYLEGETLEQVLLSRGRLPVGVTADLALQALSGLAYLHERGIVHRDIEPANLLLVRAAGARTGEEAGLPLVKILSLGLSRVEGEDDPLPMTLDFTRPPAGAVLPAPAYLAPELARAPRAVDVRADLYSLGCVLYHSLAGQPPFTAASLAQLVLRHSTESPRPLRGFNSDVPDELARIVAQMMARDPVDRYANPAEAAEAVRGFLAAGTVAVVQMEALAWPQPSKPAPFIPPPPPPPQAVELGFGRSAAASPFELDSHDDLFDSVSMVTPGRRGTDRKTGLDRRDWLMLVAGAAGLLLIQFLAWLLGRLFGRSVKELPAPPSESTSALLQSASGSGKMTGVRRKG